MTIKNFEDLIKDGIDALEKGNTSEAMMHFENASLLSKSPLLKAYLGYCLAREKGNFKEGGSMCVEAIKQDPGNPELYLSLGRIYALAGHRYKAIKAFQKGLRMGRDQRIVDELQQMGLRKTPVFSFLSRENPVNKYLGLLLHKLGLR